MDNNTYNENCLEIIPNNDVAVKTMDSELSVKNINKEFLPVVIKPDVFAIIDMKRNLSRFKKRHHPLRAILKFFSRMYNSSSGVLVVLEAVAKFITKLIRWTFLASSAVVSFVALSAIVLLSTLLITKNVVNTEYGINARDERIEFSIFDMKDDSRINK